MAGDSEDIDARRLASSNTSPRRQSDMPVRRERASKAAKKSFEERGRDLRYNCKGEWVASRMARFIVAIVTVPFLVGVRFFGPSSAPRIGGRPRERLLGVFSKGL